MDVYQALEQEHGKARETIRRIKEGGGQARGALFAELKQDLETHTAFEEEVFYPAVAEDENWKDAIEEALAEHDEVAALLEEMQELDTSSDEFAERLEELEQALEHHIAEEEREIFPAARETISAERAAEMARRLQTTKKETAAAG